MKRALFIISMIVSLSYGVLLLHPVFCEEKTLSDGTYIGLSELVEVSVKIKDGKIKDIDITEHAGDETYGESLKLMCDDMVKKQSVYVDGITGATVSSRSLKDAVSKALEKAFK